MGKPNPLLSFGIKLLLNALEQKDQQAKGGVPELGEVGAVKGLKQKEGSVVLLLGKRESGKTICAQRLAQVLARPTYAISPEQKPPDWIEEIKLEQIAELPPPYSTLICDDLPAYMGSRDYTDSWVQMIERIIPTVRHRRKLHLIFVSQTSGQADKWALNADLVIMKPMGWLYAETERSAVKRLADKVMPIFRQMTDSQQKKQAYLFSDSWQGLVRINLPGQEPII